MYSVSLADDYYVDGVKGNDSNSGTLSNPWETITKANSVLKAGDTVNVRAGIYEDQQIKPSSSGTSINRIIYRNYNSEQVTITETTTGIQLTGRSYISVQGIDFSNIDLYVTMKNSSHYNYIEYCTFDKMRNYGGWRGFEISHNASRNWVHHCSISRHGYYTSTDDKGDMIYIGDEQNPGGAEYNLIENNTIYSGGHTLIALHDRYNVIRDNYIHHEGWYKLNGKIYGNRCIYSNKYTNDFPSSWNLIEGNRIAFSDIPSDASYSDGIQLSSPDNIIRNNFFYHNSGAGLKLSTFQGGVNANNNYIYNNVFFYNGHNSGISRVRYGISFSAYADEIKGTVLKNNIFWQNHSGSINYEGTNLGNQTVSNNWEKGDPLFMDDESPISPENPLLPDFSLRKSSQCIDAGAFLTETSQSGSGTVMPIKDSHYFMDGWGIIEGDEIQLEGQNITARIVQVDYSRNILTINRSLNWSANQGVTLRFNDSAPDMGAVESAILTIASPENLRVIE
jgi:hypothetical protein